ncbi:MAG TPA: hypothetical protein VHL54_06260 [Actinomycetota bacterium]|nr:hypothetical protein [Actinomycetota bacterium]
MADECPLCYGQLETRHAAPCEECGGEPESLEAFRGGEQAYYLVNVLGGRELILCTGCMVDFGSLDRKFLGVPAGTDYGFDHMEVVREVNGPAARGDNYCPSCGYRLKFLRFVKAVRSHAAG